MRFPGTRMIMFGGVLAISVMATFASHAQTGMRLPLSAALGAPLGTAFQGYLGTKDGKNLLWLQVKPDGSVVMGDPQGRTGSTGTGGAVSDGTVTTVRIETLQPIPGDALELAATPVKPGVTKLRATSGPGMGLELYAYPLAKGKAFPVPVVPPGAEPGNPNWLDGLEARYSLNDDSYKACWNLLRAQRRNPAEPTVFVLGNSAMREALDGDTLSKAIGQRVMKFGIPAATLFEDLLMARKLDPRPGDTLMLLVHPLDFTEWFGANPTRLAAPLAASAPKAPINTSRLPFRLFADPASVEEYATHMPKQPAEDILRAFLSDRLSFYRMGDIMEEGTKKGFKPEPWREFRYNGRSQVQVSGMKLLVAGQGALANTRNTKPAEGNLAVRVLRDFEKLASDKGCRLVLVEAPTNPGVCPPFDDGVERMVKAVFPAFVTIPKDVLQDATHFVDHHHTNPEGRRVYTQWLVSALADRWTPQTVAP